MMSGREYWAVDVRLVRAEEDPQRLPCLQFMKVAGGHWVLGVGRGDDWSPLRRSLDVDSMWFPSAGPEGGVVWMRFERLAAGECRLPGDYDLGGGEHVWVALWDRADLPEGAIVPLEEAARDSGVRVCLVVCR